MHFNFYINDICGISGKPHLLGVDYTNMFCSRSDLKIVVENVVGGMVVFMITLNLTASLAGEKVNQIAVVADFPPTKKAEK